MVKLNSTTAILLDLDGVILNLEYDIKFWESWLPDQVANQSNRILEEIKAEIQAEIDIQKGTLNFYDLNYWDNLLNVDCMKIIKEQAHIINRLLLDLFSSINIILVDFKIEFGRYGSDNKVILADEISPDSCRLWDKLSSEKLDKDRFRKNLGGLIDAYKEVATRLGIKIQ